MKNINPAFVAYLILLAIVILLSIYIFSVAPFVIRFAVLLVDAVVANEVITRASKV